jgi:hypothetical protein
MTNEIRRKQRKGKTDRKRIMFMRQGNYNGTKPEESE